MAPEADNDNGPCPDSFGRAIAAYLPGLRKRAMRYERNHADREELVGDTLELAVKHWRKFRPNGALWAWLKWQMAKAAANRREYASYKKRTGVNITLERLAPLPDAARQEDITMFSQVVDAIPRERDKEVLLRRAEGDTDVEIAADFGVTRQRIHTLEKQARARLMKRLNTVLVAA